MRKKICVLTATRAEYGLLKPIIQGLKVVNGFEVAVVATGAHLSPEFGLTYKEIEMDGINIDEKIEILLSADTPSAISKSMGLGMISFADYFERNKIDLLIVLGDRYETLAVTTVAMIKGIPIAHLYGGETTEGLIDEAIRHSITKMSYLHFTSTDKYRERVIQLGEDPKRVFNVGAIGVENIKNEAFMSMSEIEESLEWIIDRPYAVITFHPVTLESQSAEEQIKQLLLALDSNPEYQYIFTKSNSDTDGRIINQLIDKYVARNSNCKAFTSLGARRYLSVVRYSAMVIGNSSSGIIEVPSFKIPTINIGDRQKGRIQASSVINCVPEHDKIDRAIKKAMSPNFREILDDVENPYEKRGTCSRTIEEIRKTMEFEKVSLKKEFFDIGGNK